MHLGKHLYCNPSFSSLIPSHPLHFLLVSHHPFFHIYLNFFRYSSTPSPYTFSFFTLHFILSLLSFLFLIINFFLWISSPSLLSSVTWQTQHQWRAQPGLVQIICIHPPSLSVGVLHPGQGLLITRIVTELGSAPTQLALVALGSPGSRVGADEPCSGVDCKQGRQGPRCAPWRQSLQNTNPQSLQATRLHKTWNHLKSRKISFSEKCEDLKYKPASIWEFWKYSCPAVRLGAEYSTRL